MISETWGNGTFESWTYNSIDNTTAAEVHDLGNGSYRVVSGDLSVGGTTFLFVQRNGLGVPGSPFQVGCCCLRDGLRARCIDVLPYLDPTTPTMNSYRMLRVTRHITSPA